MLLRFTYCILLLSLASSARADLLLSEALSAPGSDWDGNGSLDSRDDEWIEIRNTGPEAVSLDGVFFRDGTGANYHIGFSGTLAAAESRVVYGSDAVLWQQANGETISGLSLNNSGDRLELWLDRNGQTQLLDAVDLPAHAAASQRSLARALSNGEWLLYDGLNPYSGSALPTGSGCGPSPGLPNACGGTVATVDASFSELKAVFGPQEH